MIWIRRVCLLIELSAAGGLARAQCPSWVASVGETNGEVRALAVFDDGSGPKLYAGGYFSSVDGLVVNHIARWDGATWSPLGAGWNHVVRALAVYDDGSGPALYAGGKIITMSGSSVNYVAKWDGSTWSPIGMGANTFGDSFVLSLAVYDVGSGPELFAGGQFSSFGSTQAYNIARWNGTSWSDLGPSTINGAVNAMTVFDDGSGSALYVGGDFSFAGANITRWNSAGWSSVGSGVNNFVYALGVYNDGVRAALYAGGDFTSAGGHGANRIARWDGANWAPLAGGTSTGVFALSTFDVGTGAGSELIVGGDFGSANGVAVNNIARWNGTSWSALGVGTAFDVHAACVYDDGSGDGPSLFVAGGDTPAQATGRIAKWRGCGHPGVAYCFGDGSGAACPCSNNGAPGHGCQNSAGTGGAVLASSGGAVLGQDTLVLSTANELPAALSVFSQGSALIAPVAFGDGLRCTGGALKRLFVKNASAGSASAPQLGDPTVSARSAALGDPISPASTRYYYVYYRDPNPGFCPTATFNATNSLRVVW